MSKLSEEYIEKHRVEVGNVNVFDWMANTLKAMEEHIEVLEKEIKRISVDLKSPHMMTEVVDGRMVSRRTLCARVAILEEKVNKGG